jgi:hypothetical protein
MKQVWTSRATLDAVRYIFWSFVTNNKNKFTINTRQKFYFHQSLLNLLLYIKKTVTNSDKILLKNDMIGLSLILVTIFSVGFYIQISKDAFRLQGF